uniref:Uncharacterized protein n=1 Tax=Lotharella oceanica TaxID=641309 RepID=A0A7S2XFC4_9EUKA
MGMPRIISCIGGKAGNLTKILQDFDIDVCQVRMDVRADCGRTFKVTPDVKAAIRRKEMTLSIAGQKRMERTKARIEKYKNRGFTLLPTCTPSKEEQEMTEKKATAEEL